jgi:hypothetical protein
MTGDKLFVIGKYCLCALLFFRSATGNEQVQAQTPKLEPTGARLLSASSPTKDEDPSVLTARDGTIFVAWFSDRGNNPDIYLTSTSNGIDWRSPIRVTTSPAGDFYPNLFQDNQGTFHLVWFRWTALFRGHIWHNSSVDGLTWNQWTEEQVTFGDDVDDWVPTITQAADGCLVVFFVSAKRNLANPTADIYVATKRLGQPGWSYAIAPVGLNSVTEHDELPFAFLTGGKLTLIWVRHDTTTPLPWLNPKSNLFYATSVAGQTWSTPLQITNEPGNVVNLFPAIYQMHNGDYSLIWLSNKPGHPVLYEIPLDKINLYPQARVTNKRFGIGYSHRVAATATPGIYIGVWTEGPEGSQDIFYRLFRRTR